MRRVGVYYLPVSIHELSSRWRSVSR